MVGQVIRNIGFWGLDSLKGSPVRKRLSYLEELYSNNKPNTKALEELLNHAINTVPYYHSIERADIHCFPVVSKEDYKRAFELFRSSNYQNEEELHKVFTSGSTGNPFMAYQDKEKILWHRAGLISINNRIGWKLGDRFMFFRLWGVAHNEGKLSQFMSNTIPVDVMDFNTQKMETIRQRLIKDKSLCLLLGYASALESLADYLLTKHDAPKAYGIRLIIADSESLTSNAKGKIEKAFGCPVLNRYGNNENGILGLSHIDDPSFYINFPEYYVEILKMNKDVPAKPGELGRIVITDLYNKAFPFIRYDTGDLGIAAVMEGEQCFVLRELSGRVSTVLKDVQGNLVGETAVTAFFENITGIGRYQLAQVARDKYELRVENTDSSLDEKLVLQTKTVFGDNAEVIIVHVKEIPQCKNGKYKITSYEVKD